MTLDEIRTRILENIDDVDGDVYAPRKVYGRVDSAVKGVLSYLATAIERLDPDSFTEIVFREVTRTAPIAAQHYIVSETLIANDVRRVVAVDRFVNEGSLVQPSLHPVQLVPQQRIGYYLYDRDVGYIRQGREMIGETTSASTQLAETVKDNIWPSSLAPHPPKLYDDSAVYFGCPNPLGSAAYRFVYSRDPVALMDFDNTLSVPAIPLAYHDLLVIGATFRLVVSENADARQWQTLWNEGKDMLAKSVPNQEGLPA